MWAASNQQNYIMIGSWIKLWKCHGLCSQGCARNMKTCETNVLHPSSFREFQRNHPLNNQPDPLPSSHHGSDGTVPICLVRESPHIPACLFANSFLMQIMMLIVCNAMCFLVFEIHTCDVTIVMATCRRKWEGLMHKTLQNEVCSFHVIGPMSREHA